MKKKMFLTTSVYTFSKIIEQDFLYVDKTKYIFDLIEPQTGQYFLARPRRFGKSLTLSTLKSFFLGEKELFKGLYIYNKQIEWKKYPIIHLSLNKMRAKTADELEENLCLAIDDIAEDNGIIINRKRSYQKFEKLIKEYHKIDKVVILIDEYDKPLLDNVNNISERVKIKNTLKDFYSTIKGNEDLLRFVFITGVSKFSKVSIFSELNNLDDLTMKTSFGTALGFTQEEVNNKYGYLIKKIAEKQNIDYRNLLEKLRINYNGYRFSKKSEKVYNPVSLTKFVQNGEIEHYWFETGTPTFLLELMKENNYDVRKLEELKLHSAAFSTYEIENLRVEPLLFQTGYLTIKDYNEKGGIYTLSYPNQEVKSAFLAYISDYYTPVAKEYTPNYIFELQEAVEKNDIDEFMKLLNVFYANIEYDLHIKHEKYYQTIFYVVFALIGLRINTEVKTNQGRADVVIQTDTHIYIFEFKLFDTAKNAMKQIDSKKYYEKYLLEKKEIVLIGVGFDIENRNIKNDYEVKKIN